ncbi:MAG: SPOR domain-containing protein [Bacteroidetes bacterium]|nr:SPOR domain-containing protein [Bacteroidota bacterium]
MKKFLIFISILTFITFSSNAQKARLTVSNDAYLDTAIQKNIDKNRIANVIDGYRIQLFSGAERNNANALKTKFLKLYPKTPAYLIYQQSYFKLRVGDYRTKIETQQIFYKLQDDFGQVIIIPDKINLPKLD